MIKEIYETVSKKFTVPWRDMKDLFESIDQHGAIRAIVVLVAGLFAFFMFIAFFTVGFPFIFSSAHHIDDFFENSRKGCVVLQEIQGKIYQVDSCKNKVSLVQK